MVFNSFQFIWLLPLVFVTYYCVMWLTGRKLKKPNTRVGNLLLITISYALYMQWEPKYALVLLGVTAITYFSALLIEKQHAFNKKKYLIFTGAALALLPLVIFKYTGFISTSILNIFDSDSSKVTGINIIAPIGISFFTFQAVGYLFDVYYKRTNAEHNWWDYMLFVCFFPQILSGPISKADELLPQIKGNRDFNYEQAVQGLKWLLWGMFLKTVFADRLGIYVDTIYNNYQYQSGLSCIIGCILYSFQIYGDFAGYSFMAVGVGKLMGFDLIINFQRPYLAGSITEFWHRWHISLTRWLTQNIYIPLGGNRCSKLRQYLNIMTTFLISGLWHGASWTFVAWGGIHGILQIGEKVLGIDPKGKFSHLKLWRTIKPIRIFFTFVLVSLAWVFFRMPFLTDAVSFIEKMFTDHRMIIATITYPSLLFLSIGLFIVCIKDIMNEFLPKISLLNNHYTIVRWIGYISLTLIIMMCGVFDAGSFIYVNF